jgi:pullulanase
MRIRAYPGENRSFLWSNQDSGSLALSSLGNRTDGTRAIPAFFSLNGQRVLEDCFVSAPEGPDLFVGNASAIDFAPEGAYLFFSGDGDDRRELSVSALLHERAVYLALSGYRPGEGIGLVFSAAASTAGWTRCEESGITVYYDARGFALASSDPFDLTESEGDAVRCVPRASASSASSASRATDAGFSLYCAFVGALPDPSRAPCDAAAADAIRLASSIAIEGHRKGIASFLDECPLSFGSVDLDDAVRWARVTPWMHLASSRSCEASPPEPVRERLLALLSFSLPCGHFAEARAELTALAGLLEHDRSSPAFGLFREDARDRVADTPSLYAVAVWEYLESSGDRSILVAAEGTVGSISPIAAVDLALDAALELRCDARGFLLHGPHETRMSGGLTARGDRAVEVESLWFFALSFGSRMARLRGDALHAARFSSAAERLRAAFIVQFWDPAAHALADRVPPGPRGESLPDYRVRPNQLAALAFPGLLAPRDGEALSDGVVDTAGDGAGIPRLVLRALTRELASPFGLYTLCPDDPRFHPRHEEPGFYGSEAARHNGPIDSRFTPVFLAALGAYGDGLEDRRLCDALLFNTVRMLLSSPFPGSLPRYIDATPDETGGPVMRGIRPDVPGTAGLFVSTVRAVLGFRPRLSENVLTLLPNLPEGLDFVTASLPFGPGWKLDLRVARVGDESETPCSMLSDTGSRSNETDSRAARERYRAEVTWRVGEGSAARDGAFQGARDGASAALTINGVPLVPETPIAIRIESARAGYRQNAASAQNAATVPDTLIIARDLAGRWIRDPFPVRDLSPPWCGAAHRAGYLGELHRRYPMDSLVGEDVFTAELSWFFGSDRFARLYQGALSLGAQWTPDQTTFRLWAPTARAVTLCLYAEGGGSAQVPFAAIPLARLGDGPESGGVWETTYYGDLHGVYYTYRVRVHGVTRETGDPFARACGVNGARSMVADFRRTDPERWAEAKSPIVRSPNDVVAYELHVADLTASTEWNGSESIRRTFLGAVQPGTVHRGVPTGFDHVRSLGITHVQLLPVFDFESVDESRVRDPDYRARVTNGLYNWGYDPGNYSVPEGSYSTNPEDGATRVRELKTLVRDFAEAGIGVVMDVVYNHVPSARRHPLGIAVPGYYFRLERFSGAGDDTASERPMFRSWMAQSLAWWLTEYRLSGFRFDLMGLIDVRTMNEVADRLRAARPDVLLYGEGWDMYHGADRGRAMVPASMLETRKLPGIGFFNDAFRCAVKGSAFAAGEPGFIHDGSRRESVKFGIVGAVYHPQVHNRDVIGTVNPNPWTDSTASSVNYTEIHDNMTLYDKLVFVEPGHSDAHYERLQRLSIALVLLAQGMPILHAGMEFMRTKELPADIVAAAEAAREPLPVDVIRVPSGAAPGAYRAFSHNSYNLSDRINALDWDRCAEKRSLVDYVRGLIALRRAHSLFRLSSASEVALFLSFVAETPEDLIQASSPSPLLVWMITGAETVDAWQSALVVCNVSSSPQPFALPSCPSGGLWRLSVDADGVYDGSARAGSGNPGGSEVTIAPKALYVYAEF